MRISENSRLAGGRLRVLGKVLPEDARAHNRALVLGRLFHGGATTRADLARVSGLTRVTVSDLVADLMAEGLVEELGQRPGTHVGKPATLVGIVGGAFHIVSLDLSGDERFVGAVVDVLGRVVVRRSVPLGGRVGDDALRQVVSLVRRLVRASSRPLLGVGVGSPGVVGVGGVISQAPNLGWYGVGLGDVLGDVCGVPVFVANDADAAVLAERTFGGSSGAGCMVVKVGHGVSAGIVLGGVLWGGVGGAAGEVGHVVVDEGGVLCACGRRGCLETVLSVPAMRVRVGGLDEGESESVLGSVGRCLGAVLAPVVSVLNVDEVVLSGPVELLGGAFRREVLKTIRERTISYIGGGVDVRMTALGEDVVISGAAALVLNGQLGVS